MQSSIWAKKLHRTEHVIYCTLISGFQDVSTVRLDFFESLGAFPETKKKKISYRFAKPVRSNAFIPCGETTLLCLSTRMAVLHTPMEKLMLILHGVLLHDDITKIAMNQMFKHKINTEIHSNQSKLLLSSLVVPTPREIPPKVPLMKKLVFGQVIVDLCLCIK